MSADNGIYIYESMGILGDPEYRIAHCQAIDNITENKEYYSGYPVSDLYAVLYFSGSEVYYDLNIAYGVANDLSESYNVLEYGIRFINTNSRKPFLRIGYEKANSLLYNYEYGR